MRITTATASRASICRGKRLNDAARACAGVSCALPAASEFWLAITAPTSPMETMAAIRNQPQECVSSASIAAPC